MNEWSSSFFFVCIRIILFKFNWKKFQPNKIIRRERERGLNIWFCFFETKKRCSVSYMIIMWSVDNNNRNKKMLCIFDTEIIRCWSNSGIGFYLAHHTHDDDLFLFEKTVLENLVSLIIIIILFLWWFDFDQFRRQTANEKKKRKW